MEKLNNPTTAVTLGVIDLALIAGSAAYFTNKISGINSRIDKLEEGKSSSTIKNDSEFIDSINDIYDRLEFAESENEKLKEKIARLEHITNKLIFAMNSNNMPITIEQEVRRIIRPRPKPSSTRSRSSVSKPPKPIIKNTEQEDCPQDRSFSVHDDDDDVLLAVEEARKQ